MINSPNNYVEQNQNQNEKFLLSKNVKKNKKTKKNNNQKYKDKRPFDWICNRCNNLNYSFRTFCNICNLPKSQNIFFNSSTRNSKWRMYLIFIYIYVHNYIIDNDNKHFGFLYIIWQYWKELAKFFGNKIYHFDKAFK